MTQAERDRMNRLLGVILTSLDEIEPKEVPAGFLAAAVDAVGDGALFPAAMVLLDVGGLTTRHGDVLRLTSKGSEMAALVRAGRSPGMRP